MARGPFRCALRIRTHNAKPHLRAPLRESSENASARALAQSARIYALICGGSELRYFFISSGRACASRLMTGIAGRDIVFRSVCVCVCLPANVSASAACAYDDDEDDDDDVDDDGLDHRFRCEPCAKRIEADAWYVDVLLRTMPEFLSNSPCRRRPSNAKICRSGG